MTYSKTDFLGRGREKSTAFLETSRKFEGLGLELVSRNLTLVQQKATPGPRHVVLELPFVGGARTEGGRWTIQACTRSGVRSACRGRAGPCGTRRTFVLPGAAVAASRFAPAVRGGAQLDIIHCEKACEKVSSIPKYGHYHASWLAPLLGTPPFVFLHRGMYIPAEYSTQYARLQTM